MQEKLSLGSNIIYFTKTKNQTAISLGDTQLIELSSHLLGGIYFV